jgi:hypothetical protein
MTIPPSGCTATQRQGLLVLCAASALTLGMAGCSDPPAREGTKKIESTEVFKKLKGVKPAPSRVPDGR